MKNRISATLVSLLMLWGGSAAAGPFASKSVALQFARTSSASDNPRGATVPFYTVSLSDGNHGANAGVAVAFHDTTTAIDVRDHWARYRLAETVGQNGSVAGALVQDTLGIFGTLTLKSTRQSTGDTLVIFRDISSDGLKWVVADSIAGHAIMDSTFHQSSAVSDSIVSNVVPSLPNGQGGFTRFLSYSWNLNPYFAANAVTAQASIGVNFIRFRLHMTAGDFAAAGTTDGITGSFSYLALEPNYNK